MFLPFVLKRTRSLMELPATERNVLRLLAMSAHFLVLLGAILESFDTLDLQRFIPRERVGVPGADLQASSSSACVIQLVPSRSTATYSLDCWALESLLPTDSRSLARPPFCSGRKCARKSAASGNGKWAHSKIRPTYSSIWAVNFYFLQESLSSRNVAENVDSIPHPGIRTGLVLPHKRWHIRCEWLFTAVALHRHGPRRAHEVFDKWQVWNVCFNFW